MSDRSFRAAQYSLIAFLILSALAQLAFVAIALPPFLEGEPDQALTSSLGDSP